jgi:hypothetical protein
VRLQEEVPWLVGLKIDTFRNLSAAVSPNFQSPWPILVSSSRKLTATVIFNASSVLRHPLKEQILHGIPSNASYFKFQYLPLLSENPRAAYVLFLVFPSLVSLFYLSFNNVFQKAVLTQDVNNPVSLLSFL